MFTGLVQAVGTIHEVLPQGGRTRLVVDPGDLLRASSPAGDFVVGESISVSGTCLTLVEDSSLSSPRGRLAFDAVPETLRRTSLGRLVVGSKVNLERSVTPTTLLGGHVVQGHVDGVGEVVHVQQGDDWRIRVVPAALPDANPMEYLVPKGSITMEGVSLTIASLDPAARGPDGRPGVAAAGRGWFEVALIPTTLALTNLADLRVGMSVNLEFDAMVKTIVHWLRHYGPSLSPASLPIPGR